MITINNINIIFNDRLVLMGDMNLNPYELTVVSGQSGSGKTSLLNMIGLLDKKNSCEFSCGKRLVHFNEYEDFRLENISYVFQEYNIIDDLTIKENFETMYNLAGKKFDLDETEKILGEVSIDKHKMSLLGKKLSGGERQRIAIALSLVKKPKLLLLDEPTANLDEYNSNKVIEILNRLKENGMIIVVASHHPELYDADHVYKIDNKKIIEKKKSSASKKLELTGNKKLKRFNYVKYSFYHISKHIYLYAGLLIAISFSLFIISKNIFQIISFHSLQVSELNKISDNEIFLNNNESLISDDEKDVYLTYLKKFDSTAIEKIKEIKHVKSIYPYSKVGSSSVISCNEKGEMILPDSIGNDTIKYDNNEFDISQLSEDKLFFTSCDKEEMVEKCFKINTEIDNGVFISNELFNLLGIEKLAGAKIVLKIPVIMGYYFDEGYEVDEDGSQISESAVTNPIRTMLKEVTVNIKGVYEKNADSYQYYDNYNGEDIYIDFNDLNSYHHQILNDDKLLQNFKIFIDGTEDEFIYSSDSSSYIIKVDDIKNVEVVEKSINDKMESPVFLKTRKLEMNNLQNMLSQILFTTMIQPVIVLAIVLILLVILYIYTLHNRKKELSFLNAMGLSKSFRLPLVDIGIVLGVSIPVVIGCFVMSGMNNGSLLPVSKSVYAIILFIVSGVLALVFFGCLIINYFYFKNVNITENLRSK